MLHILSPAALVLTGLLIFVNVLCFSLMGVDKARARRGKRRIPEQTLFFSALLFGGLGGFAGMHLFHHKTKHWYFRYGFLLLMAVQLILIAWAISANISFL